jgi:hypothetical protein
MRNGERGKEKENDKVGVRSWGDECKETPDCAAIKGDPPSLWLWRTRTAVAVAMADEVEIAFTISRGSNIEGA